MKRADDLILEQIEEDGELIIPKAIKLMEPLTPDIEVTVQDYLAIIESHHAYTFNYLAELVLDMLEATDSLPEGKQVELENLLGVFHLDKARRIHDLIRSKRQGAEDS